MSARIEGKRLAAAIDAARRGDQSAARRLILAYLKDNPRDELAWSWACEVAASQEERIQCLQQILALNPQHTGARRYLARLQAALPAQGADKARVPSAGQWLMAPLGCLMQISATHLMVLLLGLALVVGIVYYTSNTDLLGLVGPDFEELAYSGSQEQIQADDMLWQIRFEKGAGSRFSGLVRHVSPIRLNSMRILTHDILVTSGQFADPALVKTSVINHRFRWRSTSSAQPEGTINLLHTVPANQEIYRQLLKIRSQDKVAISGREILRIEAYDQAGNYRGEWHDTGCNTVLVDSVEIVAE